MSCPSQLLDPVAIFRRGVTKMKETKQEIRLEIEELEERIAPDVAPGQLGYEGQPGNQGNGLNGYEGQPGNQGGGTHNP